MSFRFSVVAGNIWQECNDFFRMLSTMHSSGAAQHISTRQYRLLACAIARQYVDYLEQQTPMPGKTIYRQVVKCGEFMADTVDTQDVDRSGVLSSVGKRIYADRIWMMRNDILHRFRNLVDQRAFSIYLTDEPSFLPQLVLSTIDDLPRQALWGLIDYGQRHAYWCDILRHIVGHPWLRNGVACSTCAGLGLLDDKRCEYVVRPQYDCSDCYGQRWIVPEMPLQHTQEVVALAQAVYNGEQAHFALHDLLIDRGYSPHVAKHFECSFHPRGCYLLDRLTGRL